MVSNYIGKVKVSKSDSLFEFTDYNYGTVNLFKFFANCLMNNFNPKACPAYIDIRYLTQLSNESGAFTGDVVVSSITVNNGSRITSSAINNISDDDMFVDDAILAVQLTASFSRQDFIDIQQLYTDNKSFYLVVAGEDRTIELARLSIDLSKIYEIVNLDADQKVNIEWTMIMRNSDKEVAA